MTNVATYAGLIRICMLSLAARETAVRIFEGRRYQPSGEDIERLSSHLMLLEERGMGKLNKRLIEGGRGIWDTFVEHNFASELASSLDPTIPVSYEPEEVQPPPDFKIEAHCMIYWIQVKNLSVLERENRQANLINEIKRLAEGVPVGRFFGCQLSESLTGDDLSGLQQFITSIAPQSTEGQEYFYPDDGNPKAKIIFWPPTEAKLSSLALGISGDMGVVEITDSAREQIKRSLIKACSAFKWNSSPKTINLIVIEADEHHDIDVCDALFGKEFELSIGTFLTWDRKKDGLYDDQDFSEKVAGVIGIRRKEKYTPICEYRKILYISENFKEHIDNIKRVITYDKAVSHNMRPASGNFEVLG